MIIIYVSPSPNGWLLATEMAKMFAVKGKEVEICRYMGYVETGDRIERTLYIGRNPIKGAEFIPQNAERPYEYMEEASQVKKRGRPKKEDIEYGA